MTHFPDKLRLEDAGMVKGTRVFILETPFRYVSSLGTIEVPSGTPTDGASVPRIFWNIFEPFGEYFGAAVVHDFLYSEGNVKHTRLSADNIFKEAMFNLGVGWLRRGLIYRAVRLFGGSKYSGKLP